MTGRDEPSAADLPKFSVNVVSTRQIAAADLAALLERFRAGDAEPLIFGDGGVPEAAVIPFADLVGILRRGRAEDHADRSELSRRIREADDSDDPGLTLDELGDEIGEPARSMIRRTLDDG